MNICGRLRTGVSVFPSLELAARNSPAFKESVLLFEKESEPRLSEKDKKRMLVMTSLFDEIVPSSTSFLQGTVQLKVPMIEHSLSGAFGITFLSKKIFTFLKQ